MKNSRPRIKHAQIPHSVAQRIESLTNRIAAALLLLICRKTIGFGQSAILLSNEQIAQNLKVSIRSVTRAAKILEDAGDIVRKRKPGSAFFWSVVLHQDEIIEDPRKLYLVREEITTSLSTPSRHPCLHPHDNCVMTPSSKIEQPTPCKVELSESIVEQKIETLKKEIKEINTKKKQQQEAWACSQLDESQAIEPSQAQSESTEPQPESVSTTSELASRSDNDDEPLYKICLRELTKHGVSQRVARQLCKEHDHKLIASVLKTAPQRAGIKNLAAYIVSEIKDGGYEQTQNSPSAGEQKNAHQVSGGRSNYAHLTDNKVNPNRHKGVKAATDAPIVYKSYEQTKIEREALERQKLEQEKAYHEEGKLLAQRFKSLPDSLQFRLKLAASVQLSKLVPMTGTREQMLQDKTFQRLANRTVLECFFSWIDEGLDENQALLHLESKAAA